MVLNHQIRKIGSFHLNHCEDDTLCADLGENRHLLAVMDGCTMGDDSYFASTLFGRLLRKIAKEEFYREYIERSTKPMETQIRIIFKRLFEELIASKVQLQLKRNELLTTVLVAIIDKAERRGEIICVGDGLVNVDGVITEFDQDNQPDYLAYHLDEDFYAWYKGLAQRIRINQFEDISLCTDGILTFVDKKSSKTNNESLGLILDYLLVEKSDLLNENMFVKKINRIEEKWNMVNTDDLGIIRTIIT